MEENFPNDMEQKQTSLPETMSNVTVIMTNEYSHSTTTIVVLVMLLLFSLSGTVGNAFVLYIYGRRKKRLTVDIFMLTLASTDLVTCLVIVPFTFLMEMLMYSIQYDGLCKLYYFLIASNVPFSVFIMVAIAVDRYVNICQPLHNIMTVRRVKVIIAGFLLLTSSLGAVNCLLFGVYTRRSYREIITESGSESLAEDDRFANIEVYEHTGECIPNTLIVGEKFRKTYEQIYLSLYVWTILIVVIMYGMICHNLLTTRRLGQEMSRQRNANVKAAAVFLVVSLVFVICFLPSLLMAARFVPFNHVVYYMYFVYNVAKPLIYAFMNQGFRDDLKALFICGRREITDSRDSNPGITLSKASSQPIDEITANVIPQYQI